MRKIYLAIIGLILAALFAACREVTFELSPTTPSGITHTPTVVTPIPTSSQVRIKLSGTPTNLSADLGASLGKVAYRARWEFSTQTVIVEIFFVRYGIPYGQDFNFTLTSGISYTLFTTYGIERDGLSIYGTAFKQPNAGSSNSLSTKGSITLPATKRITLETSKKIFFNVEGVGIELDISVDTNGISILTGTGVTGMDCGRYLDYVVQVRDNNYRRRLLQVICSNKEELPYIMVYLFPEQI